MRTLAGVDLPDRMQAVELEAEGAPLRVVQKPMPTPGDSDVLVRMAAAPINPSDLMFMQGRYGLHKPLPVVPGFEGSGTVVAVGSAWWLRPYLGQRVACGTPDDSDGTWAEYLRTPAMRCIPLQSQVSLVQGASLIVNPLTAWALVEQARMGKHRAIIQTAAASSLGLMVVRLAQRFQIPLINIVRREAQMAILRGEGATYILNSSDPAFQEQLKTLCASLHPTIAFDAVGGDLTQHLLRAMPDGSRVVVYGGLAGKPAEAGVLELIFRKQQVQGFWLSDWFQRQSIPTLLRTSGQVQGLLEQDFRTTVQAAYPLAQVQRAIDHYTRQMSAGKVLLTMG